MNLNGRLAKLREQQRQIAEALRQAEAEVSVRQRKAETRTKIILGGALLAMTPGERDALLPMFVDHISERDRQFVSDYLARKPSGDQPPSAA